MTGIVQDPENLAGQFALVIPGQVTAPDQVTVLFDAPGATAGSIQSRTGLDVYTAHTAANANEINPETISITAAVLGMLLIALVGTGGFTVLAQRRLRAIGMLAAQGATERNIRLVIRANGTATGIGGAAAGLVTGFGAWLAYRPHAEISADHVMGVFQMPWTVIVISMALAVIATYFAASRPAKAIARIPIVAALAGLPPAPARTRHLAVPIGIGFLIVAFLLFGTAGRGRRRGPGPLAGRTRRWLRRAGCRHRAAGPGAAGRGRRRGKPSPIAIRLALRDLARPVPAGQHPGGKPAVDPGLACHSSRPCSAGCSPAATRPASAASHSNERPRANGQAAGLDELDRFVARRHLRDMQPCMPGVRLRRGTSL